MRASGGVFTLMPIPSRTAMLPSDTLHSDRMPPTCTVNPLCRLQVQYTRCGMHHLALTENEVVGPLDETPWA